MSVCTLVLYWLPVKWPDTIKRLLRRSRRILKESCRALCISVWNGMLFRFVFEVIYVMLPCSHSVKIANIYTLTSIFPDLSPYEIFLEESRNIELSNLKIWSLTFRIQGNEYLAKNCFAEVLSSILTMIPYVNSTHAHDCWWKGFRILCFSIVFLITHDWFSIIWSL